MGGGWGWGSGVASPWQRPSESSLSPDFLTVPLLPRAGSSSCDEEDQWLLRVSKGYLFYPHLTNPLGVVISMTDAPSVSNVWAPERLPS